MHPNQQLIHTFYQAFQRKDYETMKQCYHPDAVFDDEVFRDLNAYETGMMWEMLIKSGKGLELGYCGVEADDQHGKAVWVARYSFSKARRKVVNTIQAAFEFQGGRIIRHTGRVDFYKWARQALGYPGLLLGWPGFFRNKVRAGVKERLQEYIAGQCTPRPKLVHPC